MAYYENYELCSGRASGRFWAAWRVDSLIREGLGKILVWVAARQSAKSG